MLKIKIIIFSVLLLTAYSLGIYAQNPKAGFIAIPLNDLSAFRQPGKNWVIGSGAIADLNKPVFMELAKGFGTLVNIPTGNAEPNLATIAEMGDIELDLDFMLAKGAEARVYLQGRYGVQLSDSWAKQNTRTADCGGITARWDETRPEANKEYEGIAPLMDVCRAPGLWQHLNLIFRSPRINDRGEKTGNAKFEEVYLNGVLVQSQVQLSGPAKNALFKDEKNTGPLVLQAAQGSIACRNINYRMINPLTVHLDNIRYKYYKGEFNGNFPDLSKLVVAAADTLSQLTWNTGKGDEVFALDMGADMQVPVGDNYTFSLLTNGLGRLYIDGQLLIERITNRWNHSYYRKQLNLSPGMHKIRVVYVKNESDVKGALSLSMQGSNSDRTDLHDKSSAPVTELTDPVIIEPKNRPYLLRSFLNYGNAKLTHVISVGDPRHTNYSYDLKRGALIQVWRGAFLDVTNMWVQRGEPQLAAPLGSVVTLSDAPQLAALADANSLWPDSVAFDDLQNKGYVLDSLRSPTFKYVMNGAAITDKISTAEDGQSLFRELTVSHAPANFYCRITTAEKIDAISEGLYRIDDKSYYIRLDKRYKPVIRNTPKGNELIIAVSNETPISYYITW